MKKFCLNCRKLVDVTEQYRTATTIVYICMECGCVIVVRR